MFQEVFIPEVPIPVADVLPKQVEREPLEKSKKDSKEDKRVQRTKKKKSSFSSSMQEDESITSESTHFRLDDQVPFGNFNVYISESKVGRIKFNLLNRY